MENLTARYKGILQILLGVRRIFISLRFSPRENRRLIIAENKEKNLDNKYLHTTI